MKHTAKTLLGGNGVRVAVALSFVFFLSFVSFTNTIHIVSAETTTSAGSSITGANDNSAPIIDVSFDSYPRVSSIVVDDIIYLPTQLPIKFSWPVGSVHEFGVLSEHISEASGSRYTFDRWNDFDADTNRSIKLTSNLDGRQFIAIFNQQYLLTVVTDYGTLKGAGWYNSGDIATISLVDSQIMAEIEPGKTRAVFTGWSVGQNPTNPTNAIEINRPTVVTAGWKVQHWISVESDIGHVKGSGWYDEGIDMRLSAVESVENQAGDIKYIFGRWEALTSNPAPAIIDEFAPTATLKVNGPYIVEAHWSKLFSVRLNSEVGNPVGQGYYSKGDVVRLSIDPYYEIVPGKVRLAFAGWQEDAHPPQSNEERALVQDNSISIKIEDAPITLTPVWIKQYFVKVSSAYGDIQGSGWHDEGTVVTVSSPVSQINTGVGKLASLHGFVVLDPHTETLPETSIAASPSGSSVSYTIEEISRPYEIKAIWQADNMMQHIIIALVVVTIAGSFGLLILKKKKVSQKLV